MLISLGWRMLAALVACGLISNGAGRHARTYVRMGPSTEGVDRRGFLLAGALTSLSASILPAAEPASASVEPSPLDSWKPLRSVNIGARALRNVETEYSSDFAAYLARVLINWDPVTRKWWAQCNADAEAFKMSENVQGVVADLGAERSRAFLVDSFGSLITSVEVSLEQFDGPNGARSLAAALMGRYKEPGQKRALAQLFSFVDEADQPTEAIAALIGELDDAAVSSLALVDGGSYGSTPPVIQLAPPPTSSGRVARARAEMRQTGRIRRVTVVDGGIGYEQEPTVTLPPPSALDGVQARAVAVVRDGAIVSVELVEPGTGYTSTMPLVVTVGSPVAKRAARLELVRETTVKAIVLTDAGRGYSSDEPPAVSFLRASRARQINDVAGDTSAARALATVTPRGALSPQSSTAAVISAPLPLPRTGELRAQHPSLLPPDLLPRRSGGVGSAFALSSVERGGALFGARSTLPIEAFRPLSAASVAKVLVARSTGASTCSPTCDTS